MGRRKTGMLVVGLLAALGILALWGFSPRDRGDVPDPSATAEQTTGEDPEETADADAGMDDRSDRTEENGEPVKVSAEGATPRPGVAAEVAPVEVSAGESADDLVAPVIVEYHRALEEPTQVDWDSVVAIADGGLLDMIEVSVLEYSELGWSQVGTAELVFSTVVETDEGAEPPTVRVEVCLDYDLIDVVDSTGASLVDETAETRVRSILTLDYLDDRWVASAQDFTGELSC